MYINKLTVRLSQKEINHRHGPISAKVLGFDSLGHVIGGRDLLKKQIICDIEAAKVAAKNALICEYPGAIGEVEFVDECSSSNHG